MMVWAKANIVQALLVKTLHLVFFRQEHHVGLVVGVAGTTVRPVQREDWKRVVCGSRKINFVKHPSNTTGGL